MDINGGGEKGDYLQKEPDRCVTEIYDRLLVVISFNSERVRASVRRRS